MSIVQGQTTSFKVELYQGVHNFLTDTFKIALYTANADLNQSTTVYTASNEISGTGYTATGKVLTGTTINSSGTTAYIDFDNVIWDPASFTARCALIYNSSKADRSVAVLDFGSDKTTTTKFTITMPTNSATNALIRME
jgi:hypothetical protein